MELFSCLLIMVNGSLKLIRLARGQTVDNSLWMRTFSHKKEQNVIISMFQIGYITVLCRSIYAVHRDMYEMQIYRRRHTIDSQQNPAIAQNMATYLLVL